MAVLTRTRQALIPWGRRPTSLDHTYIDPPCPQQGFNTHTSPNLSVKAQARNSVIVCNISRSFKAVLSGIFSVRLSESPSVSFVYSLTEYTCIYALREPFQEALSYLHGAGM